MFKIIKKGSNNFWHILNNGAKNVSISDFEVVLDDVLNTFVIVLRNGANIPQIALYVLDIIVIDETASSVEETFLTASQLRARLVQLNYTAYISSGTNELSQLTDVDVTGLTNGQVLVWNSTTNKWTATTIGGLTTPTLNEVVIQGDEIVNTAGDLKIVLDKESNGMFLYELVSGSWENRGYYNNQGFTLGDWGGNTIFDLNIYSGLLTISQGTDVMQFSPTSATKNGVEFATEDFALKRDGSNANSDVDLGNFRIRARELAVYENAGKEMFLKASNLTTQRDAQFQDKDYSGIADITDIPTTLAQLSTDSANQRVSTTEKATWNALIGGSIFQSVWNASTNTPSLTSSVGTKGYYYIVNVAGTTSLNGISDWQVGDWAIFDGSVWRKVDNTDAISSFNSRTGAITLLDTDVTSALGYTPVTNARTINTKPLSSNVTLTTADIADSTNKRYQTDNQNTFNDATSSIQTQLNSKQSLQSFMRLTSAYTGTSSTSLQKMFNVGSSGNGSYSASANTTFKFKVIASLSGLSATSGTISFGILGTANITNISYNSNTIKSASLGTSQQYGFSVATASVLTSGNTATTAKIIIEGIISVTTAGTIIPAFALSQTTTPVVDANSYFEIVPIGSNTITNSTDII